MSSPEAEAREKIDEFLVAAGWAVQDYKKLNLSAARGIALREVPLKSGPCDYLLLVDRVPLGVIEAKKAGTTLSGVSEQSSGYAAGLPDFLSNLIPGTPTLPFRYESTGVETQFLDAREPDCRSRRVFAFHQPETLAHWLANPPPLRARLKVFPPLATGSGNGNGASPMRGCQIEAITSLEASFARCDPRALIQMATGAGKTYTACAFIYRLIKHAGAKRILFLVDRANLGRQAKTEFDQFVTPDTGRKFTELYNVQHLASNQLDDVSRVTICTIQRLYSMLRGEELDEDLEEKSTYELSAADSRPKEVAYNRAVPIEAFDFIVTDECHRSIYNLWRQVLEYFDAFLIGLTATPSKQTIGFFNQNLVTEYNHERAVADGVNVGYSVYRIRTDVTERGGKVDKGLYVDKRHRETRAIRWQRLDEDFVYDGKDLDRSVVVKSQIRTVLTAFKDSLPELFPGRTLVPKTLIFAKDDSHAEDIVHLVREVFGKGNDFAKKITYKTYNAETKRYEKSETLIQEFRTSPQLRIAVTVDMIATGTDIKPLECLLFLRDVRSRVYFEQMKGRGTRVLTSTDLQSVSGADAVAKTHFVIVDAVGVCESDKTDSRPLDREPATPLPQLLLGVALGKRDEDTLTTLAARLARLDRAISRDTAAELKQLAGGKSLADIAGALLDAVDPDVISGRAGPLGPPRSADEIAPADFESARKQLAASACAPFDNPVFRDALAKAKQDAEQTIDVTTVDRVLARGYDATAKQAAAGLIRSFRDYVEQHQAEITALQILYSRPYAQRLTEPMLKELEKKLRENHAAWTEDRLWDAFAAAHPDRVKGRSQPGRFADLVALVRFALEQQPVLEPFAESVRQRFDAWLAQKAKVGVAFSADQITWLELMRDQIATSVTVEPDDFEFAPFSQRGGLGRAHQLFGSQLAPLLEELNRTLAA